MNTMMMIIISIVAGLLSTMNLWADSIDDMRIHWNDLYMVGLMVSWMVFLESIYGLTWGETGHGTEMSHGMTMEKTGSGSNPESVINQSIISGLSILVFIYFIRNQTMIDDRQFIQGMIPHHSMAITMAERIKQRTMDPRIKQLAENIIRTQRQEIKLMKGIEGGVQN